MIGWHCGNNSQLKSFDKWDVKNLPFIHQRFSLMVEENFFSTWGIRLAISAHLECRYHSTLQLVPNLTVAHLVCAVLQHSWPVVREMKEMIRSASRIFMINRKILEMMQDMNTLYPFRHFARCEVCQANWSLNLLDNGSKLWPVRLRHTSSRLQHSGWMKDASFLFIFTNWSHYLYIYWSLNTMSVHTTKMPPLWAMMMAMATDDAFFNSPNEVFRLGTVSVGDHSGDILR